MRVTVVRSGGFAGITRTASVDDADLSPEEAQKMDELVGALRSSERREDAGDPRRDGFEYAVTVETNAGSQTIAAGDADVPPPLRQQIDWVTATAGPSG